MSVTACKVVIAILPRLLVFWNILLPPYGFNASCSQAGCFVYLLVFLKRQSYMSDNAIVISSILRRSLKFHFVPPSGKFHSVPSLWEASLRAVPLGSFTPCHPSGKLHSVPSVWEASLRAVPLGSFTPCRPSGKLSLRAVPLGSFTPCQHSSGRTRYQRFCCRPPSTVGGLNCNSP